MDSSANPRGRDYRALVQNAYSQRKARNPHYSIRAFSRDLGVSKTTIAEVLTNQRHLSPKNALRVADALGFSPRMKEEMFGKIRRARNSEESTHQLVSEDRFRIISDWYHYAILSLCRLEESTDSPDWFARRLGVSTVEISLAVDRLIRLNYLERADGKLKRLAPPMDTEVDVPSSAVRRSHRQNLDLAAISLDRDPVNERCFTSITMAIDPQKLPEAKKLVQRFRNRLSKFLYSDTPQEVYTLSVQLFPTTMKGADHE